jgi:hypothetical protein
VVLYDFSIYAKRKAAARYINKISELRLRLNEPGAVIELKSRVETYFVLHKEIIKQA